MPKLQADDSNRFTTEFRGICGKCKHLNRAGKGCAAYPDGIPFAILMGEFQHTEHYHWKDDHGILYESV